MNGRREYEIAFVGLKPGIHEFEYTITDKFFTLFQQQDFKNCEANIKVTLDKKNGFMLLKFEVGGKLEIACDRCNNNFPLDLWDEFHLMVKLVEDPESMNQQEEDPDVYYISKNESHIHLEEWFYEFINLSIPMQRSCDYPDMSGPYCNPEVRDALNKMNPEAREKNNIWKGLEKFKDLENN